MGGIRIPPIFLQYLKLKQKTAVTDRCLKKASNRNRTDNWTLRVTCFAFELWKRMFDLYIIIQKSEKVNHKFKIFEKNTCNFLIVWYSRCHVGVQMSAQGEQCEHKIWKKDKTLCGGIKK